jgi:release factor glutamine methyltransferase
LEPKTLDELFRHGAALLGGRSQAFLEAKTLLLKAARISEENFFASPKRRLSPRAERTFLRLLEQRISGVPVSYLTGNKEFWSLPLEVSRSVLVPRPETEALVEKVLELSSREPETILDVGTGCGNIALALAKELSRARIHAVDISQRALRVARRNASRHGIRGIRFTRSNLLSAFRRTGMEFDFIVSNPPYVSKESWAGLPPEIREYEPRLALVAGESGLELIRRLVRQAGTYLRPGGYLVFEIGDGQRDSVLALFGERWTEIETSWDLAGKPRVITARRSRRKVRRRQAAKTG